MSSWCKCVHDACVCVCVCVCFTVLTIPFRAFSISMKIRTSQVFLIPAKKPNYSKPNFIMRPNKRDECLNHSFSNRSYKPCLSSQTAWSLAKLPIYSFHHCRPIPLQTVQIQMRWFIMVCLIRTCNVCHSDTDFRLKPLFASVDKSKFENGRVHFRNSLSCYFGYTCTNTDPWAFSFFLKRNIELQHGKYILWRAAAVRGDHIIALDKQ